MRKELGLIVMGAVAFDLGTVIVPERALAQAADYFLKIDGLSGESNYLKFTNNDKAAANKCVADKGTLVEFKGDKYCRTAKAGTAVPSTQRK